MPLSAHLLLAVTALFCFASIYAIPMGMTSGHQCRCITTTDIQINPRWLQKMEIVPPGPHCRNTEIIITLKDKKTVCVVPETQWVQSIINKFYKGKKGVKK